MAVDYEKYDYERAVPHKGGICKWSGRPCRRAAGCTLRRKEACAKLLKSISQDADSLRAICRDCKMYHHGKCQFRCFKEDLSLL